MIAVGVKELKNRLSEFLREVHRGEVVLVTDRGRVVAELRQPGSQVAEATPGALSLQRLRDAGNVEIGLPQTPEAYRASPLPRSRRIRSQALLDAERGEE